MNFEKPEAEINEIVTHTEYSTGLRAESHIPKAIFVLENGLPIKLHTKLRDYEVKATSEATTAEIFFEHNITRHEDGTLRSVTFSSEAAAQYFGIIASEYRSKAVSTLRDAGETEIALEHFDKPGGYTNKGQEILDDLHASRLMRETTTGAEHDTRENKVTWPGEFITRMNIGSEELIEDYFPPERKVTDKKIIKFEKGDWYNDMTEDVLAWIESLRTKTTPITLHKTVLGLGKKELVVNRVVLGEIKTTERERFLIEEKIAEKVIFAADILKKPIRREIFVYDAFLFDNMTPDLERFEDVLYSKPANFTAARAFVRGNYIFLNNRTLHIIDENVYDQTTNISTIQTHHEISKKRTVGVIDHEIAHVLDTNYQATLAQKEGFADSMQNGFVFDRAVNSLRSNNAEYGKAITPEMLYEILSNKAEGFVAREYYRIPTTFYCYIYEKLGTDKFMRFYNYITAGEFKSYETGVKKIHEDIKTYEARKYYQGNVLHCLEVMPKDHTWTWNSPEDFVADYIKAVNAGLKKTTTTE